MVNSLFHFLGLFLCILSIAISFCLPLSLSPLCLCLSHLPSLPPVSASVLVSFNVLTSSFCPSFPPLSPTSVCLCVCFFLSLPLSACLCFFLFLSPLSTCGCVSVSQYYLLLLLIVLNKKWYSLLHFIE